MTTEFVKVPHIGEGLREVKIVNLNKNVGEFIKKDEVLYEIETDKAVMEIESPIAGIVKEWLVAVGDVIPLDANVARVEILADGKNKSAHSAGVADSNTEAQAFIRSHAEEDLSSKEKMLKISPRIKAYCKELNLTDTDIKNIAEKVNKITTVDVDNYLKDKNETISVTTLAGKSLNYDHKITPIGQVQKTLNYRFKQSKNKTTPSTVAATIEWDLLKNIARNTKEKFKKDFVSEFQVLSFCVAKVISAHVKMRSILQDEENLKEYNDVNLGFAVTTMHNNLVTAVIDNAASYELGAYLDIYQAKLDNALNGNDQAHAHIQFLLTYMGDAGVEFALPLLVYPATAILFIGSPFIRDNKALVNLVLTFNHDVVNGMEAAAFLQNLKNFIISFAENKNYVEQTAIGKKVFTQETFKNFFELKNFVIAEIKNILHIAVDMHQSLGEQGLDSIKAIQLIKNIDAKINLHLSPVLIWRYPSAAKLINYLAQELTLATDEKSKLDVSDESNFAELLSAAEKSDKN